MSRSSNTAARLAHRVREDERGMTLIELLVGISMGLVITFAAFLAIDSASKMGIRTDSRIDAVNRGRNAMSQITTAIRAQQCYNGTRPTLWAADSGMEFYSSISPMATSTFQPVERHQIKWEPKTTPADLPNGGKPVGDIYEYVWRQDPNTKVWATTAKRQRLAQDVEQAPDRRNPNVLAPIFRYYKYSAATGSGRIDYNDPVDMTGPVQNGVPSAPATDLAGIVLVELSYRSTPRRGNSVKTPAVNFYNTVSVRIADPTNPGGSPQCL
jgi:type II secretory pathway pseudopilin PulG